jgi:Tfp pilus assembly protein PilF
MNARSKSTAANAAANRRLLKESIAALQAGDFTVARERVNSVLDAEPENFDARHLAAVIESEARNLDAALRAFDAALALRPCDPEVLVNRGLTCQKIPDLEQALSDFDRAIAASRFSTWDDSRTLWLVRTGPSPSRPRPPTIMRRAAPR